MDQDKDKYTTKIIVCDRCNGQRYHVIFMTSSELDDERVPCEKCKGNGTVNINIKKEDTNV